MKKPTPTDPLSKALRELPAHRASDGFTQRVLSRLGEAPEPVRTQRLTWRLAAATVAALAVAAILVPLVGERTAPEPTDRRVEQLQNERDQLLAELEQLQRARTRSQPVIYLGSSSDYDLVLDLDPLLAATETPVVPTMEDLRIRRPMAVEASRRQQ